jgi:hypothetical protein
MSQTLDTESPLMGPAEEFAVYAEAELERRRNAEQDFDEAAYREAVDMVLRKLQVLEGGGFE